MFNSLKVRICALVVGLGLLSASMTNAAIIVVDPVVSGSGPWTFTYDADLFNSDLEAGDFFVIYDFHGYVDGSIFAIPTVGSWTLNVQKSGPIPFAQTPVDSAGVDNLVFTYNGPKVSTGALGQLDLGTFGAQTTMGKWTDPGNYAAQDTKLATSLDQGNIGPVGVPVPLPAAAWTGMALLGALGIARARKLIAA